MPGYSDIFFTLEAKNEWELASQLKALPLGKRVGFFLSLFGGTVETLVAARRYTTEWQAADARLVRIAELLLHSASDRLMMPYVVEPFHGVRKGRYGSNLSFKDGCFKERTEAEKRVPAVCAMTAIKAFRLLPQKGKGFRHEVDQADVNTYDAEVPVFEKARAYLLRVIAENWAKGDERSSSACMEFLLSVLDGDVVEAIKDADKQASRERIEKAFLRSYEHQEENRRYLRPYDNLRRTLGKGWAKKIDAGTLDFAVRINAILGKDVSEVASLTLLESARALRRLDAVAHSFFALYFASEGWKVSAHHPNEKKVTVTIPYDKFRRHGLSDEGAINDLKDKLKKWKNPDPEVKLVIKVVKRDKTKGDHIWYLHDTDATT